MKAINPFIVLEIDEAATRDEIDAAYRRLALEWHPDRHAGSSPEEQAAATQRMTEIADAHRLLTDPAAAAAHRRRIERVRAAGVSVEPPPQRRAEPPAPDPAGEREYRVAARAEFPSEPGPPATPWVATRKPRRFRRR